MNTTTPATNTAPIAPVCPECKGGDICVLYSYAGAELVAVAADGWTTVGDPFDFEVSDFECTSCQFVTRDAAAFFPEPPLCLVCEIEHEHPYQTADGFVACDSCYDAAATAATATLHLCDECADFPGRTET